VEPRNSACRAKNQPPRASLGRPTAGILGLFPKKPKVRIRPYTDGHTHPHTEKVTCMRKLDGAACLPAYAPARPACKTLPVGPACKYRNENLFPRICRQFLSTLPTLSTLSSLVYCLRCLPCLLYLLVTSAILAKFVTPATSCHICRLCYACYLYYNQPNSSHLLPQQPPFYTPPLYCLRHVSTIYSFLLLSRRLCCSTVTSAAQVTSLLLVRRAARL
jgi:hypothetical protein